MIKWEQNLIDMDITYNFGGVEALGLLFLDYTLMRDTHRRSESIQ